MLSSLWCSTFADLNTLSTGLRYSSQVAQPSKAIQAIVQDNKSAPGTACVRGSLYTLPTVHSTCQAAVQNILFTWPSTPFPSTPFHNGSHQIPLLSTWVKASPALSTHLSLHLPGSTVARNMLSTHPFVLSPSTTQLVAYQTFLHSTQTGMIQEHPSLGWQHNPYL